LTRKRILKLVVISSSVYDLPVFTPLDPNEGAETELGNTCDIFPAALHVHLTRMRILKLDDVAAGALEKICFTPPNPNEGTETPARC
jgi:hypothetical protein